jgi:uncharacterized protein (TIGR03437 family)
MRLSKTSFGPISVATGQNGNPLIVEATNVGDGSLNLTAASSMPWVVPTIGTPRACGFGATCTPVNIALNTGTLAAGKYTAFVTVSDPNALDAPQTIGITVLAGGGIPAQIDMYAAPGAVAKRTMTSNSTLTFAVSTQSGGSWLSVGSTGTGIGAAAEYAVYTYVITANGSGLGEGTYRGTVTVSGSTVASENGTKAVTFRVTSQPIAVVPEELVFRIAAGAAKQTQVINVGNAGGGTLTVAGATPPEGQVAAAVNGNAVSVTADPGTSNGGTFVASTVSIASNAVNSPVDVPVRFDILPPGPPLANAEGAVNNATFEKGDNLAPGEIVAIFGEKFTNGGPVWASQIPLEKELGDGVKVFVNGVQAPLYYISYNQINFQLPFEVAPGDVEVRVERQGGGRSNGVSAKAVASAPRTLRMWVKDYGLGLIYPDNALAMAPTPGIPSRAAKVGDVITLYAIGLGQANPAVATGAGAPTQEPLARVSNVGVRLGTRFFDDNVLVTPEYAGMAPYFVGLYQINFRIPANTPKGAEVPLTVETGNTPGNRVTIAIE